MKILAGPYTGEWGWEIMRWQGVLRWYAHNGNDVIVVARQSSYDLYKDFASEFIPNELWGIKNKHFPNGWRDGNEDPGFEFEHINSISGIEYIINPTQKSCFGSQVFIRYHEKPIYKCDIVIHAREVTDKRSRRNWPRKKWDKLTNKLSKKYKIAAIGATDAAYAPKHTMDFTGYPLCTTISLLSNAKLVVGPSSGPMHLASLCCTPHLVWANSEITGRYEKDWNPLGTECKVIYDDTHNPDVGLIHESIAGWGI